jgi:tryptophanyl-tRNA synthetase
MEARAPHIALTGFKPTGTLHLGNYLGALAPAAQLAKDADLYCFVADLHALNMPTERRQLRERSLDVARHLIAFLPDETKIYCQSAVPQISELAMLLAQVCPTGLLRRSHAYKVAREANVAQGHPPEANINMGLALYPLLMAADMLAVGAQLVPIGPDQLSHHELARDLRGSFHARFGSVFPDPAAKLMIPTALPGLDGRKMSKSYDNVIPIFGPGRSKAVKRIVTDSRPQGEPKTDMSTSTVHALCAAFDAEAASRIESHYRSGGSDGEAKAMLCEALDAHFAQAEARYSALDEAAILERLEAGGELARERAGRFLAKAKSKVGLL